MQRAAAAPDDRVFETVPKEFQVEDRYTTFTAHYRWDGERLTVHFFRSPEQALPERPAPGSPLGSVATWKALYERAIYSWSNEQGPFALALSLVAPRVMKLGPPELRAYYVEEEDVDSWCLIADRCPDLNPAQMLERFFRELDEALSPPPETLGRAPRDRGVTTSGRGAVARTGRPGCSRASPRRAPGSAAG
jgi:hypothetical protein